MAIMAKKSPTFACTDCGDTCVRWSGKCPSCGALNTIKEINALEAQVVAKGREQVRAAANLITEGADAASAPEQHPRLPCGMLEIDRVLGGGLVPGGVTLIGGEPGIGKSTLLAQISGIVGQAHAVLYVTAEESTAQVRARLERLSALSPHVRLAATNDAMTIAGAIASGEYRLVVVDSIQLLTQDGIEGEPGGVAQCRSCAATLVEATKRSGRDGQVSTALMIVGHVTKDGNLAGPRLLEHLVDTVLSFEGDRYQDLRVVRAVKNRYGSTNDLALLRMGGSGLIEVTDPTGIFITDRDPGVAGSCVVPTLDGNRCLLVEVQALVNETDYPQPVRKVAGADQNRVAMILAVLSRRLRLPLGGCDVFVNVTGGARIQEPAADLAIALAVASAWRDIPVPADMVALGEVGLGGELRPATRYDLRATEARRLGFKRLLGPGAGSGKGRIIATRLSEAIEAAFAG
jgi:DNA repair protein RadA/Sms